MKGGIFLMTRLERAKNGEIFDDIRTVARTENISEKFLTEKLAYGEISFCSGIVRKITPSAVGNGLRIKVNANIGTSSDASSIELEIEKALCAVEYGADTIMDLSTGGDIVATRKRI